MTARLEFPNLLAGFCIQAVQLAEVILVQPLADVHLPVRHTRRREHLLHLPAVVEGPELLARLPVHAVDGAVAEATAVGSTEVDALAGHGRRRGDKAPARALKLPHLPDTGLAAAAVGRLRLTGRDGALGLAMPRRPEADAGKEHGPQCDALGRER